MKIPAKIIDKEFLKTIQNNPGISALPSVVESKTSIHKKITRAQRLHAIKRLKRKGLIYEENGRYYPILIPNKEV